MSPGSHRDHRTFSFAPDVPSSPQRISLSARSIDRRILVSSPHRAHSGKWAIAAVLAVQRKGFGEDFRGTRDAKWTKQPSTGRGRDAIERLFDLYSVVAGIIFLAIEVRQNQELLERDHALLDHRGQNTALDKSWNSLEFMP